MQSLVLFQPRSVLAPRDIIQHISSFCNVQDEITIAFVCKSWYHTEDRVLCLADKYYYIPEKHLKVATMKNAASNVAFIPSSPQDIALLEHVHTLLFTSEMNQHGALIAKMVNLKSLARGVHIKREGLQALQTLRNVTSVDLGHSTIPESELDGMLTGFPRLTHLSVRYRSVSADIEYVAKYAPSSLTSLDMRGHAISDTGITALAEKLTNLTYLDARMSPFTDTQLKDIATHMTQLKYLDLEGSVAITDTGVQSLAQNIPGLTTLYLGGSVMTDAGLKHISSLTNLTQLSLLECRKYTDAGLKELGQLTKLQSLDLSNAKITSAGLMQLSSLVNLNTLSLKGCNFSDADLANIMSQFPNLKSLDLRGCSKAITEDGIYQQLTSHPKLETVLHSGKILNLGIRREVQKSIKQV